MEEEENFYQMLEVSQDASQEEIKKNYRKLALKYHPDKNRSLEATKRFQKIYDAYQVLSDKEKRNLYDRHGRGFQEYSAVPLQYYLLGWFLKEGAIYLLTEPFITFVVYSKAEYHAGFFGNFNHIRKQRGIFSLWRGFFWGNIFIKGSEEYFLHLCQKYGPFFPADFIFGALLWSQLDLLATLMRMRMLGLNSGINWILPKFKSPSALIPFSTYYVAGFLGDGIMNSDRFNDWLAKTFNKLLQKDSVFTRIGLITLKCACLCAITTPFKTWLTRAQVGSMNNPPMGAFATASAIVTNEGVSRFWSGYICDVVATTVTSLVSLCFSEINKLFF